MMTDQHPLTDEIIEEIWEKTGPCDPAYFGERHPSPEEMRAAYDLAIEQVIRVWDDLNTESFDNGEQLIVAFDQRLRAMRPQVVDLPQSNSDVCGEEGAMRAFQRTINENDELMRLLVDSQEDTP
jgi:hypothetical protein